VTVYELLHLLTYIVSQDEEILTAAVVDMSVFDGRWHWLLVEVTSSLLSLSLDNSLLIQR